MISFQTLEQAAGTLNDCVWTLASSFPSPVLVQLGERFVHRHEQQDDLLLSYLKLVRSASAHNAALVLLRAGYAQEAYALCRMTDEAYEDILFMAQPHGPGGAPTEDQRRFINEFFQEEHEDPDDPTSSAKRDRVSRQRIRAATGRALGATDPSAGQRLGRALYQTMSGFVHGAYVHIMELFGGAPPRFHTRGMLGTERMAEAVDNHAHYLFRSLLAAELVGRRAYRADVVERACTANVQLARGTGCLKEEGIAMIERRAKEPLVHPSGGLQE